MPQITTQSGRTLDDVLNDECHDRDRLNATAHAFPSIGEITMPARTFDLRDDRTTRRGDSIVPQQFRTFTDAVGTDACKATTQTLRPASHRTDPHTSPQAAGSMAKGAQRHRVAIMTALRLFGPATGHELAARLGLEYVQVAKRLTELAADGRINRRETGTIGGKPAYQTRNSPTGRPACVWHINPLSK